MIQKLPRKKLIKLLITLDSISFLSYLFYDFNPNIFSDGIELDYIEAGQKIEKKDYTDIHFNWYQTFLSGENMLFYF